MTISAVVPDLTTHPVALLPLAKNQLRVDGTYDDAFITAVIARAIASFEQLTEVTVNPTTLTCTLKTASFKDGFATLPVRPAQLAAPMTGYAVVLKWDGIHGIPILALQGAAADVSVNLVCGYASAAAIPPAVQDAVLRITAHLYEHREILIPDRAFVAPDVATDATWWMPRL